MTIRIPSDKSRLLLVEGADDVVFFRKLTEHLDISHQIHLVNYEGRNNLLNYLIAILSDANFANNREHIGIVRDADYNTNAFDSVISALKNTNKKVSSKNKFAIPPKPLTRSTESPYVSVLIVPVGTEGALEDLILAALQVDPIMPCVNDYFECLKKVGKKVGWQISRHRESKSKLSVFISGKNAVSNHATQRDTKRKFLREAVGMSWWRAEFWEHESFNDAKAFLRQLVMD